ncbi:MAG: type II CAAX endopeptidase family protein, partial [Acidobacteriaceae bacterium]
MSRRTATEARGKRVIEPTESQQSGQEPIRPHGNRGGDPRVESRIAPASPDRHMFWVFLGPQGLRAGWAILLFSAIFYVLLAITRPILMDFLGPRPVGPLPPLRGVIGETLLFGLVVATTGLLSIPERKSLLYYGYQGRARGLRLVSGMLWGFVAISALVLLLWKLGYLALDGRAAGGRAALEDAVLWGAMFLLTGFFEESLFRGYVQFTLTRGIGFWWGALLFALVFGFVHAGNPGESPVGLLSVGAVGLVFCLSLWYTGSLWWAVGFHAAWDWGESYFYGTADSGMVAQGHLLREHPVGAALWSGGTTGPEGSVLVLALLAAIVVLMWLWWGRRG